MGVTRLGCDPPRPPPRLLHTNAQTSTPPARRAPQARLEPPWPGLCSQPGADLADYQALKQQLQLLIDSTFALAAACGRERLDALAAANQLQAGETARAREALAAALGAAAAGAARCADALGSLPLGGPSHGPALRAGARWAPPRGSGSGASWRRRRRTWPAPSALRWTSRSSLCGPWTHARRAPAACVG